MDQPPYIISQCMHRPLSTTTIDLDIDVDFNPPNSLLATAMTNGAAALNSFTLFGPKSVHK